MADNKQQRVGFFDTPVRRVHLVRAGGLFVVAIAVALMPLMGDIDFEGKVFCAIFAVLFAGMAVLNIWWGLRTSSDKVEPPLDKAPVPEQLKYFRHAFWVGAIGMPIITIWLAYNLHQLETGRADHVSIPEPFGVIYTYGGYWAAVISSAMLGVACCAVCLWKLRKLMGPPADGVVNDKTGGSAAGQ